MRPLRDAYLALRDALGRPASAGQLRAAQTEQPRFERLAGRYADHPVHGLTPARMAAMLDAADAGDVAQDRKSTRLNSSHYS